MAWYDIPLVNIEYVRENNENVGIQMSAKDYQRLIEKMEDFLDNLAVEEVKRDKSPFYSHEAIKKLIASRKR
jgi:hypothetical protein